MSDAYDSLEAELAAFQPHEPSPELKQRIADRLTPTLPSRSRRRWGLALAGGLVAAGLVAAVFLRRGNDPVVEAELPSVPTQTLLANAFDDSLPSFWMYRTALAQSPEALEALLDKHAVRTSDPKPEHARVFVFARFDSELDALSGEL